MPLVKFYLSSILVKYPVSCLHYPVQSFLRINTNICVHFAQTARRDAIITYVVVSAVDIIIIMYTYHCETKTIACVYNVTIYRYIIQSVCITCTCMFRKKRPRSISSSLVFWLSRTKRSQCSSIELVFVFIVVVIWIRWQLPCLKYAKLSITICNNSKLQYQPKLVIQQ